MFFHRPFPDSEDGCCCEICYKKTSDFVVGENIGDLFIGFLAWVLNVEESVKEDILEKAREGTLFSNGKEGLPMYDRVVKKVKESAGGFICNKSLDKMIEKDGTEDMGEGLGPNFGMYSAAVQNLFEEEGIIVKSGGEEEEYDFGSAGSQRRYQLVDRAYSFTWEQLPKRMTRFTNLAATDIHLINSKDCKLCPSVERLNNMYMGQGSSSSLSYFVFSDMVEELPGDNFDKFSGKGYSVKPHGFVFEKEYNFKDNNVGVIHKFDEQDFDGCDIEELSEEYEFVVKKDSETLINHDNFTFSFPAGSVNQDLTISITKVSFSCDVPDVEKIPENLSLRNVLIETKKVLENSRRFSYFYEVFQRWRILF